MEISRLEEFHSVNIFFLFILFLLLCVVKRLLLNKYGVTGSVFEIASWISNF